MTTLQAVILGIVEGLTEFLPMSSTGHMILADSMMQIQDPEFVKTFEIAIQLGAIAAVALLYIRRFLKEPRLYFILFIAFLPTGVCGLLFYKYIKTLLFNPLSVSIALILGGVVLLFFDKLAQNRDEKHKTHEIQITPRTAFIIGLFQTISMIPGVSRAAATIGGGLVAGLSRVRAVEFSFLLAVPTMVVATAYDLYKNRETLNAAHLDVLVIGALVAFATALLAVRFFVAFISKRGFTAFGIYRIVVGIIFLVVFWGKTLTK
ncbi:MAG TPA: undecaprenyl-diphosphate phosphatase [Turneriella sp.]|nr:undecaprenyl-diphosphate phosphatase [Turneriella sp.]